MIVVQQVKHNEKIEPITKDIINIINKKAQELASNGMQVIALAEKNNYPGINNFTTSDEKDMTLIGFVAFLDPPKSGVKETLKKLKKAKC